MVGSYNHIVDKDGAFIGIDLIDNLGDAHEALEECYLIIQILAKKNRKKINKTIKYMYKNWDKLSGGKDGK